MDDVRARPRAVRKGRCVRCGTVLPLTVAGTLRAHLRDGRLLRVFGRRCPGVVPALGSVVPPLGSVVPSLRAGRPHGTRVRPNVGP